MSKLNKPLIRQSFERAAKDYMAGADLQRCLATRLMSIAKPYLSELPQPAKSLDAGCGCGINIPMLQETLPSYVVGIDIATTMLQQARDQTISHVTTPSNNFGETFVCGDLETLPIKSNTFDIVFSSATLQWCNDTTAVIQEFKRVLNPSGLLLIATYGPKTLYELRNSWQGLDTHSHTLDFLSTEQLTQCLDKAEFKTLHCHQQREVVLYQNVRELLLALKAIGVKNCRNDRDRGLTSPARMQTMMQNYTQRYGNNESIPASYELILLIGQVAN